MLNKTRIYDKKVKINNVDVKSFWEKRASIKDLNSVLLGNQNDSKHSDLRNEKEFALLKNFLTNLKDLTVLDIGCGIGRWANNLKDKIKLYHGIDFSENFINNNKERFRDYKNLNFMVMSASDMDLSKLKSTYDLIIINGVLMYINDDKLSNIFRDIKTLSPHYIYIQESTSILDDRLTLKNFYSAELDTQYNAIYRTKYDYEYYFKNVLINYEIKKTSLLLDKDTGAREETNAQYWFLERNDNDRN